MNTSDDFPTCTECGTEIGHHIDDGLCGSCRDAVRLWEAGRA